MSETVKFINDFFKNALKSEVDNIKEKILFTERQEQIFELYYIKKKNVNFIADTLFVCPMVINKELKSIREKIIRVLHSLDTKSILLFYNSYINSVQNYFSNLYILSLSTFIRRKKYGY